LPKVSEAIPGSQGGCVHDAGRGSRGDSDTDSPTHPTVDHGRSRDCDAHPLTNPTTDEG